MGEWTKLDEWRWAKGNFAGRGVPKYNLGTRETRERGVPKYNLGTRETREERGNEGRTRRSQVTREEKGGRSSKDLDREGHQRWWRGGWLGLSAEPTTDILQAMIGDIRKLKQNQPFVPFTIHLADGRHFEVPTTDHFLIVGSRAVVLNDNDGIEILPALLMSDITTDISALPAESEA